MRLTQIALPVFFGLPLISAKPLAARSDDEALQDLNDQALSALQTQYDNTTANARTAPKCNIFNAKVRRDW